MGHPARDSGVDSRRGERVRGAACRAKRSCRGFQVPDARALRQQGSGSSRTAQGSAHGCGGNPCRCHLVPTAFPATGSGGTAEPTQADVDGEAHQCFCSGLSATKGPAMKKVVDAVIQFAALGTILAVLATVVHELFFYWWLAPGLVDLPQAGDYITTAARWLPAATFMTLVGAVIAMFVPQPDGRSLIARNDNGQTSVARRSLGAFANLVMHGIAFIGFVYGFHLLLFDPDPPAAPVGVFLVVFWFVICLPAVRRAFAKWAAVGMPNPTMAIGLAFTPSLLVLCAVLGIGAAQAVQDAEHGAWSISIRDDDSIENVLLVRNLASGVLIAIPQERNIRFFPWSGVTSLTAKSTSDRKQSRLCKWSQSRVAEESPSRKLSLARTLQRMCRAFTGEERMLDRNPASSAKPAKQ